jgi:DNA-3-methyladenine glycosylase
MINELAPITSSLPDLRDLQPLPRSFYEPSARSVAPALLGHWLLRRTEEGLCGGPIVETEAYLQDDAACHGAVGLTPRNRVMFGPPGAAYVYLIYGLHYCVNAVCQPSGTAEAVLIRAVEAAFGRKLMLRQRPTPRMESLTNGPAKLCQAMSIDRSLDGADLCKISSPLLIVSNPQILRFLQDRGPLVTTTRIGITRDATLQLRFVLRDSLFISVPIRARTRTIQVKRLC